MNREEQIVGQANRLPGRRHRLHGQRSTGGAPARQLIFALAFAGISLISPLTDAQCLAPPAGIVAWWDVDGNVNDRVGANNGTIVRGVTLPSVKSVRFSSWMARRDTSPARQVISR